MTRSLKVLKDIEANTPALGTHQENRDLSHAHSQAALGTGLIFKQGVWFCTTVPEKLFLSALQWAKVCLFSCLQQEKEFGINHRYKGKWRGM